MNDRRTNPDGERHRFTSRILPPYMRRSPKVAEVLPVLYLRGLSTGDFREALAALLGDDAAGLSATNIAPLTNEWETEYRAFQQRSLADRDYVYVWVDGVHFNVRLDDDRLCTLVMIGARIDGTKELIAVEDGYRESSGSWKTVLRDLKRRGMRAPMVAVGDSLSASGRPWRDVWPKTRAQRDWFHKLGNILDTLPEAVQPRVKAALHEVMYARVHAREAITRFATEYGAKYPKAVTTLEQDADALLTFFDFRRTLEVSAHVERDRVPIRNGAAAPARDEGRGLADERTADGLQAPRHGAGPMATARRRAPPATGARWGRIRGRRAARRTSAASPERAPRSVPSRLSIHLATSIQNWRTLAEASVDQAKLAASISRSPDFKHFA